MRKYIVMLVVVLAFCFCGSTAASLLEYWEFEDSAGLSFNRFSNSGSLGSMWNFGGPGGSMFTDGAGHLVVSNHNSQTFRRLPGAGTVNADESANQYAEPFTTGVYRLSLDFASWDIDSDAGSVMNFKVLSGHPSGNTVAGILLKRQDAATARVQMFTDLSGDAAGYRNFDYELTSSSGGLFEIEFDFDNDTVAYYLNGSQTHSFSDFEGIKFGSLEFSVNSTWNQNNIIKIKEMGLSDNNMQEGIYTNVLESWTYTGAVNGNRLNEEPGVGSNPGGIDWDNRMLQSISNEMIVVRNDSSLAQAFIEKNITAFDSTISGVYRVEYEVPFADLTSTVNNELIGFQSGFGFHHDDVSKNAMVLFRMNASQAFQLGIISDSGTVFRNIPTNIISGSTASNLKIGFTVNLDNRGEAGSMMVDYSVNGIMGGQISHEVSSSFEIDKVIFVTQVGSNAQYNLHMDDAIFLDNIVYLQIFNASGEISTPSSLWNDWVSSYSLGAQSNALDHADADGYDNLTEYAFGGDPTNSSDHGNRPVNKQIEISGKNYIEYVYYERVDASERGLESIFEKSIDLIYDKWVDASSSLKTTSGLSDITGFNAVTNRIPVDEDKKYIRFQIRYTPES